MIGHHAPFRDGLPSVIIIIIIIIIIITKQGELRLAPTSPVQAKIQLK